MQKTTDLILKDIDISSKLIRSLAEEICGSVSDPTWVNWRKWAQISGRARTVTASQALTLLAISYLRKDSKRRELSRHEVNAAQAVVCPILIEVIERLQETQIPGYMAIDWLKQTQGVKVSESTLRRRLPKFSRKKLIRAESLRAAIF